MARESDYGVNDFGLKIATVNGTGSASANGLLLQALFRMGIPVSGKNVFPSNIQGLPTWYEVRVNKDGYTARSPDFQLGVAMNPESYARDIEEVVSGGWILYDNSRELDDEFCRDDVTFLGIPLADMCVEHFQGSRIRILMKNITYVGALVALLDIDMDVVKGMLQEKFASKQHLMDANYTAIELGHTYALEHFDCPLPIRLEAMDKTKDCVMVTGNAAAALGCVYAGATVGSCLSLERRPRVPCARDSEGACRRAWWPWWRWEATHAKQAFPAAVGCFSLLVVPLLGCGQLDFGTVWHMGRTVWT